MSFPVAHASYRHTDFLSEVDADVSRETVLSLIEMLNAEKFDEARRFVHDDMQFVGVLGTLTAQRRTSQI